MKNRQAFPGMDLNISSIQQGKTPDHLPYFGMTLRDYFAAKATEQDVQEYMWRTTINTGHVIAKIQIRNREEAKYAYADAMIKESEKQ